MSDPGSSAPPEPISKTLGNDDGPAREPAKARGRIGGVEHAPTSLRPDPKRRAQRVAPPSARPPRPRCGSQGARPRGTRALWQTRVAQFTCTECHYTFVDPHRRVRIDRRKIRDVPACPRCLRREGAGAAGPSHRLRHIRRWFCDRSHASFYPEPIPPAAPPLDNFKNPSDPTLREAAGSARAVQVGGTTVEAVRDLIAVSDEDARCLRKAGVTPPEIRRPAERTRKIRVALERLLAEGKS